ncbi:MAG: tRNA lysidine(34) synthetase TilS [Bacteroidetes bacterium]|nr:tRNA lysidine(34) synthetase TilS [Bacteroidota bacterium]
MKTTEQKVIKFIYRNKLISPGDSLLIALSGGPDSIFALHFFQKFKDLFQINLHAFHLNHQLRGEESDGDEDYCRNYCSKINVPLTVKSENVRLYSGQNKVSIEEAARIIRYKHLNEISAAENFNKIVTAHNMSDNAETVLLNLIKGAGLSGISGIPIQRENIIRPIIILTSEEIRSYLTKANIDSRLDSSNKSNDYQRNFLRNEIIPRLKEKINPGLESAILRNSRILKNINNSLEQRVDELFEKIILETPSSLEINRKMLQEEDEAVRGLILQKCFVSSLSIPYTYSDFSKIMDLLESDNGSKCELSSGYSVLIEESKLTIIQEEREQDDVMISLNPGESKEIANKIISLLEVESYDESESSNANIEFLDLDKLDGNLTIGRWKEGDSFIPFGSKSKKMISEFLTDQKVGSLSKRNQLLCYNRNIVVWVVGLRLDNRYRITDKTKRIGKLWMK